MLRVDADGDGTVVEQFALHVSAEFACANGAAETLFDLTDELLVERNGNVMACCSDVTRAVSLSSESVQGKLTDDKDFSLDVEHRTVHDVVLVVEDAEAEYFAGDPLHIVSGIGCLEAYEDKEAEAYA